MQTREIWKRYNHKGQHVLTIGKDTVKGDVEVSYFYDDKGNLIQSIDSNGIVIDRYYDENNNEIHRKFSNGFEWWRELDENGNELHFLNSKGVEWWSEYDERGNQIYHKFPLKGNIEWWKEFDEKGNEIHFKNNRGDERWYKYDDKGNMISNRNNKGKEIIYEYNRLGQIISIKDTKGYVKLYSYKNGLLMNSHDSDNYTEYFHYNKNKKLVHKYKVKNGKIYREEWRRYYKNGKLALIRTSNGYIFVKKLNKEGRVLYSKSKNRIIYNKYDENGNTIYTKTIYLNK